jgi:hypothetical protein
MEETMPEFGWGTFFGFVADRFPSRKERIRNKEER